MLVTTHVLAGALLGAALRRSVPVAFTAGVASHLALDAVPHWGGVDQATFLHVAVRDGLVGLVVLLLVVALAPRRFRAPVLAGAVGAALLDLDKPAALWWGRSPFPAVVDHLHGGIQNESPAALGLEVAVAGVATVVVATLWALLRTKYPQKATGRYRSPAPVALGPHRRVRAARHAGPDHQVLSAPGHAPPRARRGHVLAPATHHPPNLA